MLSHSPDLEKATLLTTDSDLAKANVKTLHLLV